MFKRISIATRLWIPTACMTLALVVMGAMLTWRTSSLAGESNKQMHLQQEKLEVSLLWSGLTDANAARMLAVLASAEPALEAQFGPDLNATTARINELTRRLEAMPMDPAEREAFAVAAERRKDYVGARDAARQQKLGGDVAGAAAALGDKVRPALARYLEAQSRFVKVQQAHSDALREDVTAQRMRSVWGAVAAMVLMIVLLAFSTLSSVRLIRRPLRQLVHVADSVGQGDLGVAVDRDRHDEIGDVQRALADMRDSLRGIVGQVRESAASIQVASSEVAAGNQDLSQRTEQAASSLQQTASSMEQLTGHVRHSAQSAAQADQLAASASAAATRGGQVVDQVVATMNEIQASSRKISDIIGTIDGIAFQTNILALNAAVEAARAGEQGRGFAVVASEVRSLAQRSAGAAREIKALIGASVEKVESGVVLVREAGSTMSDIVHSVQRVTDTIGEISAATSEQSQGIGEIGSAVSGLDQMTQQNAALVEQGAAAAESLKDQAQRLHGVVGTFRLQPGDTQGAAPVARAPASAPNPARPAPAPAPRPASALPAAAAQPALPAPPVPGKAVATAGGGHGDWETF